MKHPFKINDVVYHAAHGKCEVESIDNHPRCSTPVYLKGYVWVAAGTLSFSPWEKPDWERPKPPFIPVLLAGIHVHVRNTNGMATFTIVVKHESEWSVDSMGGVRYPKDEYTFHRIYEEPVKFN